jgi:AcrR family transcriptional regulator
MDVNAMNGRDKREAQGDATRLALLAAARQLFGEKGYAATSIEEIAAQAGVTKGAVYHHFGGKGDLFQDVYEQVMREVSDQVVSKFN